MNEIITQVQFEYFKDVLKKEGTLELKARGGCMWPFLKDGAIVRIIPATTDTVAVGEIVLTFIDNKFFCHRIFRKGHDFLQTKADALVGLDAKVSEEMILGKVIALKKANKWKRINNAYYRAFGLLIVWITLLTAPCYPFLRKIKKITLSFI